MIRCGRGLLAAGSFSLVLLASLLPACDWGALAPTAKRDHALKPNASVVPQPLGAASLVGLRRARDLKEASPSATRAAPRAPVPLKAHENTLRDRLREASGVILSARFRASDPAPNRTDGPAPTQPNARALYEARKLTAGRCTIKLAAHGRMRFIFESRALPLAPGSVLLKRVDRYGSLVVWPNGRRFRALQPGVLRSVMGEGRVDVTPMFHGDVTRAGAGERLGRKTQTFTMTSPMATLKLELVSMPDAGAGGPLLCRMLVEMAGIHASSEICEPPNVVVWADYRWKKARAAVGHAHLADEAAPNKMGLVFEVLEVRRRAELRPADFQTPPSRARAGADGLPLAVGDRFFSDSELGLWRHEDESGVLAEDKPVPTDASLKHAPPRGIHAHNRSDMRMYLLLDGIPVAAIKPWRELKLGGLRHGAYKVRWRSFLGDIVLQERKHRLPAWIALEKKSTKPDSVPELQTDPN